MQRCVLCAVALAAAGCVSSGTWRAVREVERELDALDAEERGRDADEAAGERAPEARAPERCDAIVARVLARYPGLAAPRLRARAALARARAEGALPAPRAGIEVWDFPIGDPQLADREGMYMIGLSQEIPPAEALDGRARAAAHEARAAIGELLELRRSITASAARACADWAASASEERALARSEALVSRMLEASSSRLSTGGEPLADLARLEAERARITRMRAIADARAAEAEARIGAMLGRAARGEARATAPELAIGGPPGAPGGMLVVPRDVDALVERALAGRGIVASMRARASAAEARAAAAEARATVPTFVVGGTYMQMPSRRAGLGLELGMTLPWLWSGEGAEREAARLEAEAERDEIGRVERDVRVEIAGALRAIDVVLRALAVLRDEERPAAERALEAISATYATGGVDLIAWLDASRALRELDVEEARLSGDAARAIVELESALGFALDPSRESGPDAPLGARSSEMRSSEGGEEEAR